MSRSASEAVAVKPHAVDGTGETSVDPASSEPGALGGLLDALPGAVGRVGGDGRIALVNRTACRWYDRPRDDLVGQDFAALHACGGTCVMQDIVGRALAGEAIDIECEISFPDGEQRVVQAALTPEAGAPSPGGFVFQLRDVTHRCTEEHSLRTVNRQLDQRIREATSELRQRNTALKLENAARRRSEKRYRIVSELMSDLIYVYRVDAEGRMRAVWFTGRLSQEFSPQPSRGGHFRIWRPLIHPDDEAILDRRNERLMRNESSVDEFRVIDRDGLTRWIRVFGKPIFNHSSQRVTRIMVAAQDITETRNAKTQLERHRYMLAEALSSMSDGFMLFDNRGKLVEYNDKVLRLFPQAAPAITKGARFESILRRSLESGEVEISPRDRERWIRERLAQFPNEHGANEVQLSDGRWILSTDRPTRDGGIVGIRTDITARKRADEQRRQQEAELAQVLRRASMGEMASALAHEISQPLSAIVNYASGLLRRMDSGDNDIDAAVATLQRICDSGQRAKDIVNHVGDFVRMGRPVVRVENMHTIVREVIDLLGGALKRTGVRLETSMPCDAIEVPVNRIEIEQVMFNLVRNAIDAIEAAAPDERRIELTCERSQDGFCLVHIADTGDGVDDEVRDTLFHPYVTTKSRGLGMGLSISRTIIEAHGGRLWVDDAATGGAIFHFRLPVANHD